MRMKIVGVLTSIVICAGCSGGGGQETSPPPSGSRGLQVDRQTVDFGEVLVGTQSAPQTVTITSTGTSAASLSDIRIAGSDKDKFTLSTDCPASIAPQTSCKINVQFLSLSKGIAQASVTYTTNASAPSPIELKAKGVEPLLTLSTMSENFADTAIGAESTGRLITLKNEGDSTLSAISITIVGEDIDDFRIDKICNSDLLANQSCEITAFFTPKTAGRKSAKIKISSNVPEQNVNLSGLGIEETAPVIQIIPTSIEFGGQTVTTTSLPRFFSIENVGNRNLELQTITVVSGNASQFAVNPNCPQFLSPNSKCDVQVIFTPTVSGSLSAIVEVTSVGLSREEVLLTGTGIPLAASFSVSSTSIQFAPQIATTQSEPTAITITNDGAINIVLSPISTTGKNFVQASDCPELLTVGQSCSVFVSFKPIAMGDFLEELIISSPELYPIMITLRGTGTAAIAFSEATLRFDQSPVGLGSLKKLTFVSLLTTDLVPPPNQSGGQPWIINFDQETDDFEILFETLSCPWKTNGAILKVGVVCEMLIRHRSFAPAATASDLVIGFADRPLGRSRVEGESFYFYLDRKIIFGEEADTVGNSMNEFGDITGFINGYDAGGLIYSQNGFAYLYETNTIIDLGNLGEPGETLAYSTGTNINNSSEVVGTSYVSGIYPDFYDEGFFWQNGSSITAILNGQGAMTGLDNYAKAINDYGVIVGQYEYQASPVRIPLSTSAVSALRSFIKYPNQEVVDLFDQNDPALVDGFGRRGVALYSDVFAINNAEAVVGRVILDTGFYNGGFEWDRETGLRLYNSYVAGIPTDISSDGLIPVLSEGSLGFRKFGGYHYGLGLTADSYAKTNGVWTLTVRRLSREEDPSGLYEGRNLWLHSMSDHEPALEYEYSQKPTGWASLSLKEMIDPEDPLLPFIESCFGGSSIYSSFDINERGWIMLTCIDNRTQRWQTFILKPKI